MKRARCERDTECEMAMLALVIVDGLEPAPTRVTSWTNSLTKASKELLLIDLEA